MKANYIRYAGVIVALIVLFIGYQQNSFYFAGIAVAVTAIAGLVADTKTK